VETSDCFVLKLSALGIFTFLVLIPVTCPVALVEISSTTVNVAPKLGET
jgi:hypothetical protein